MRRVTPLAGISAAFFCASTLMAQVEGRCIGCFNAKVVTEDGSPFPSEPRFVPARTNSLQNQCIIRESFRNGTVLYQLNPYAMENSGSDACTITISLSGYHTLTATLRPNATVVLKRIGDHEGSAVSMVSLQAPRDAKKAYDKGAVALTRGDWAKAETNFESAVEIYPQYAQAWSELAEAFNRQSKPKQAREACEHALQSDPKYLRSYVQLARLDLAESRPQDAIEVTEKAIALNPVEFPAIYFYNAVANFNLKHPTEAETSARMALKLDTEHEVPRIEVLLATLLAAKGDTRDAIEHFEKYLALSPKASDAPDVRRQIHELEQRPAK